MSRAAIAFNARITSSSLDRPQHAVQHDAGRDDDDEAERKTDPVPADLFADKARNRAQHFKHSRPRSGCSPAQFSRYGGALRTGSARARASIQAESNPSRGKFKSGRPALKKDCGPLIGPRSDCPIGSLARRNLDQFRQLILGQLASRVNFSTTASFTIVVEPDDLVRIDRCLGKEIVARALGLGLADI